MNKEIDSPFFFNNNIKFYQTFVNIIIPLIIEKFPSDEKIQIWNPTAKTGQEAVSIIIGADSKLKRELLIKLELTASDPNPDQLKKAVSGIYTGMEVQKGLPIKLLLKYFDQQADKNWKLQDKIQGKVTFKDHPTAAELNGQYHIIFSASLLNNPLIDDEQKNKMIALFKAGLKKGGQLFLPTTYGGLDNDPSFEKYDYEGFVAYLLK